MVAPVYYTADMVRGLPEDGRRYETVHGELLVTPAPRAWHQEIVGRVFESLRSYVRTEPVGHVIVSPADISWSEASLVQPDVFVVDREEASSMEWSRMRTLLLVVEVLSSSTARYDRFTKRRLYQEQKIPTYWVVNPDAEKAEVWTPAAELPRVERHQLIWHPAGARVPFILELPALFRPM